MRPDFLVKSSVLLFLLAGGAQAAYRCCAGGQAIEGCNASGFTKCADGTVDKGCRCEKRIVKKHRSRVEVLKFKPSTERGQVLLPGEEPPPTTLRDSK